MIARRTTAALFVAGHLLISGVAATVFSRLFGHGAPAVAAHLVLLAEWDGLLLAVLATLAALQFRTRLLWACRLLPAVTFTCQIYLYSLNIVSNEFWGRNITAHLVGAFAPTIWSGKEPFPIG